MVERLWYGEGRPLWLLWPLAWLYRWISQRRREAYREGRRQTSRPPIPIIVVGNITAGGTGKSPLTLAIVDHLRRQGWRPAIVSRGYGGKSERYPLLVNPETPAALSGDEPLMLARQGSVPVVVDPKRARAAQWAYDEKLADVLVCDDGLQHYALGRDLEIAVFDGARGVGNGAPIPVGPLREAPDRLAEVDALVFNGVPVQPLSHPNVMTMQFEPQRLTNMATGETREMDWLKGRTVIGVAGIGNPARFFDTLRMLGANVEERPLRDHHEFRREDLAHPVGQALVMTAKDAVKCVDLADADCWSLEVRAALPDAFWILLDRRLAELELPSPATKPDQ
ncbi:tetraacyldisaccharide 4'-kinase [Marinobacter nanhaiticus D15-8W]|uniref:Tetraacyldisaccharide 4'-kinase n=1 Tax=Marinobacter nanhaiticus D15-8W TaxID=626887 RepID=N6WYA4_9GAMM|nr:tetraacyldisaccharide 4'-kinase [Marinobacter nanhaiticus]ENO13753.1 tetraacyldisaccharide 4'-kinase [Marinobacter nanhaiticus D15-8W]BES71126.1 tetraacyldisaccharide 4'-kinase [Marinobacter nanhaiticus D15-8W]